MVRIPLALLLIALSVPQAVAADDVVDAIDQARALLVPGRMCFLTCFTWCFAVLALT